MIKNSPKKNSGYAILELLFYIVFLSLISLVVINALIITTKSFKETAISGEWMQSGIIMEKISREIRQANDISFINVNDLKLNTKDDAGADKAVEFLLSGTNIQFLENNFLTGNLNTPNITVTGLTFTQINTAKSKAVKIVLSVRSNNDISTRIQNFYDTVVLRGSY